MKEFIFNHAKCIYVVDGDTIDVEIDIGFDFKTTQRIRFYGIDTPERSDLGYLAATEYVQSMCLYKSIQIITYKKDSFGRWLSIVFVDGENLNELLIKKGLAKFYQY